MVRSVLRLVPEIAGGVHFDARRFISRCKTSKMCAVVFMHGNITLSQPQAGIL